MVGVGSHFEKQYADYVTSVKKTNKEWYNNINKELNLFLKGTVLDIGNGGLFTYDLKIPEKVLAIDISFKDIKKLPKYRNVSYLCEDARSLRSIKDNSADTVFLQFVLHHIADKSKKSTFNNIQKVMKSAHRVLKPGGNIVIIETVFPRIIELLEIIFYPLTRILLNSINKPMIFLYSRKSIFNFFQNSAFKKVKYKKIPYGKRFDVLNGLKPGLLVIPGWSSPHRCIMFIGKK